MNFFKKHIGDWIRDTAHLSAVEEGIYSRLIDQYFSREKPLPVDIKAACKLARASSKNDRLAVSYVLDSYFTLTENGYTHDRCDSEIKYYVANANKNLANGKLGGRPRKTSMKSTEPETQWVNSGLCLGSVLETQTIRQPLTTNQEPLTTNQEQDLKTEGQDLKTEGQDLKTEGQDLKNPTPPKTSFLCPPTKKNDPESVAKKPRKKQKTLLPENFVVSDAVQDWADRHGYGAERVSSNYAKFVLWAAAGGKEYVDWDAALQGAIRDEWACRSAGAGAGGQQYKTTAQRIDDANREATEIWLAEMAGSDFVDVTPAHETKMLN
jgi:uncharacterized protein YdaU (DUF1376 family)